MVNINTIYNRFVGGECSPFLAGRVDYGKYQAGAKRMINFIPLIQGPLLKRGGTRFVAETKYPQRPAWLIKFKFSESVAYVIEAGHKYFRFYTSRGVLLAADGRTPYEIATPYEDWELANAKGGLALNYIQSGDVMYLVHPNHKPQKLARHAPADWRLSDLPGWPEDRPNPSTVAFFRERLCLARGQTLWFSASGAFEDFTDPGDDPAADDPMIINIYSEETNQIEWLCPAGGLMVGATGGEFTVGEVTTADPLGPGNIKVTPQTTYGGRPLRPIRIGGAVLFVQRAGRKLREMIYDYSSDNYGAADLSIVAEHITASGIIDMAWQQEPHQILWLVRADGGLVGLTYARDQEMAAWHRHELGGQGAVESLAVIPSPQEDVDDLWLLVRRDTERGETRWVEFLTPGYRPGSDGAAQSFYVDAGLGYDGPPAQHFSGLDHLNGQEATILADGAVEPPQLITGGRLTLSRPARTARVGLGYQALLETMNFEAPLNSGTIQGRLKKIVSVSFRLWCSLGGAVGPDEDSLERLIWRRGHDPMDEPPALFTGDTDPVPWPGGYDRQSSMVICQDVPLPFGLVAIMPVVSLEGDRR